MTLDLVLFLFAAILIAALVVLLLAKPLFRPAPVADKPSADRAVYRDQLAELEREAARGLVGGSELVGARLEIQRRMLGTDRADSTPSRPAGLRGWQAFGAALCVPLAALGLYLGLGQPGLPDAPRAARVAPGDAEQMEFERLAQQIEARLAQNPADATGWGLLARAQRVLGRFPAAAESLGKVVALQGGPQAAPVETVADQAELLVFATDGKVGEEAKALFEAAHGRAPMLPKPRHYLALASLQAGDQAGALAAWRALAADAPPDAPWLPMVRERIADVSAALGEPAAARGPTAADVEAARDMSETDRSAMIRGMVEGLAARLRDAPEDPAGWLRLARAYTVLKEPEKARDAYAEAVRRLPPGSSERAAAEAALKELDGVK